MSRRRELSDTGRCPPPPLLSLAAPPADFKRLFEENAKITAEQRAVILERYDAFVRDIISRYLQAVTARFELEVWMALFKRTRPVSPRWHLFFIT